MTLLRYMATRSRTSQVGRAGSEPERTMHDSRAPTADSAPINEAELVVLFALARRADDSNEMSSTYCPSKRYVTT